MGYVGNQTTTAYTSMTKQDITGDGTSNYTLSHAVANANEIEVYINNVRQEPTTSYSASGTALTMTGTVASSDDFYVVFQGKAVGTITPPDGSVGTAKIADGAVDLTSKVTGVLPIANGGTGSSSFTASTMTLATTLATTSGTAIDFTGIPSTAKRISVLFRGVSSSGYDTGVLVQLGTSSGFVASGYISTSNYDGGGSSDSTGFYMVGITTSQTLSGIMTIAHKGSNVYVSSHSGKRSSTYGVFGGGDVSVGGTVTSVRIKQVSGGSFDAVSVNIMYES